MSQKMEANCQVKPRLAGATTSPEQGIRQVGIEMPSNCLPRHSTLTSSPEDLVMHQKVAQLRPDLEQCLTQAILTSKNPQAALVDLAKVVGAIFHAEGCLIMPQSHNLATASSSCWLIKELQDVSLPDLLNVLEHLVNETAWTTDEQFLLITNLQTTAPVYDLNPALQSKSVLLVGTQFQGRVNGVIALVQPQSYSWKESDVQLLQSLSPQVAIAISQARLEHQLQQQVRYQSLIDQLTAAIRNAWELEEIFKFAVEGTASALDVSRGMLLLFKYEDPLYKSRNLEGIPKTKANIVAEWVKQAESGKLITGANPEKDPSFWASDCRICQQVLTGKLDPLLQCCNCDLPMHCCCYP
jgi:GAF domain